MIKLHMLFLVLSVVSFITRIMLAQFKPELLRYKAIKITPHIIDTVLLLSGVTLVFVGNWMAGEYGWIISKVTLLFAYIGFGVIAMRSTGVKRWLAFVLALASFGYIIFIAVNKYSFI